MTRVADYPIHTQFTERWSPRAFTGESIPQKTLLSFFEAARWAPSAYNSQPWRFLYARKRRTRAGASSRAAVRAATDLRAAAASLVLPSPHVSRLVRIRS